MYTEHFPFEDFRPGQKEAINNFVHHFKSGGRFGALNAPLGIGKSPINYSIAANFKYTVYLTIQKQLQDQIDREKWPGVAILKGRNAYPCAMDTYFNCVGNKIDYISPGPKKRQMLCQVKGYKAYKITEFELGTAYNEEYYLKYDPEGLVKDELATMEVGAERNILLSQLVCPESRKMFCPYKIAKFVATRSSIAVLNPDIYYALKKHAGHPFKHSELLIFDEAHKINDIVKRIFGLSINTEFFNKFNIDIKKVMPQKMDINTGFDGLKNLLKGILGSYEAAVDLIDVVSVIINNPIGLFDDVSQLKGDNELITAYETSILDFCNFVRGQNSFLSNTKLTKMFTSACRCVVSGKDEESSFGSTYSSITEDDKKLYLETVRRVSGTYATIKTAVADGGKTSNTRVPYDKIFDKDTSGVSEEYSNIKETLKDLRKSSKLHGMYNAFAYKYNRSMDGRGEFLTIDPVKYDKIMFSEVYQDPVPKDLLTEVKGDRTPCPMKKVILSSGTWPHFEKMVSWFGLKKEEGLLIHSVPHIFVDNKRPVFICNDYGQLGFSEKSPGGEYMYKTEKGYNKWSDLLVRTIKHINKRWKSRGRNTNIAIHTSSIFLSEQIAKMVLMGVIPCDHYFGHVGFNFKSPSPKDPPNLRVYSNKDKMVEDFIEMPDSGSIITSPSIIEGCDFKYEKCRAQIILKRPTPIWGELDVNLKTMGCDQLYLKRDPAYFDTLIMIAINQAYGRVVRADDDYGETYVLDMDLAVPVGIVLGVPSAKRIATTRHYAVARNLGKMDISYFLEGVRRNSDDFIWEI